jgi:hypothetical protein
LDCDAFAVVASIAGSPALVLSNPLPH